MTNSKERDFSLLKFDADRLSACMQEVSPRLEDIFDAMETLVVCYGEYGDKTIATCAKMLNSYAAMLAQFASHGVDIKLPPQILALLDKFGEIEQTK